MEREAEVMEQAYAAMLGGVSVINSVIAHTIKAVMQLVKILDMT